MKMLYYITLGLSENYQVYIYNIQSLLYSFLVISVSKLSIYSLLIVFLMGIITSLTPCLISVVPLSIAYMESFKQRKFYQSTFLLGLVSSTFFTMFIFNAFNYKYLIYFNRLPVLSSIILLIFSLNLLQILDLSGLIIYFNSLKNLVEKNNSILIYHYLTGFTVGLSSLPCSSPIIFIISFWLSHSINIFITLLYFGVYSFGYLVSIFFIFNFSFNYIKLKFISDLWKSVIPFAGCVVLTVSLLNLLEELFI